MVNSLLDHLKAKEIPNTWMHRYTLVHTFNRRVFNHELSIYLIRNSESCYVFKFIVVHGLAKMFNISNNQNK